MAQEKEYFAFISYQRKDEGWAKWLAHELEHYHLPSTLNGKDLPKSLRPVFRDVDELSAGNLPDQIYHALSISKNLIVVCSPRSAKSEWVNKEIEDFIKIKGGNADNIYPFIIKGIPFSKDIDKECFPERLRNLPENEERLGGNINEQGGRNAAVVKIIAGMLGIGFDSLWQKYEREKKRKKIIIWSTCLICISLLVGIAKFVYSLNYNNILEESKMLANEAIKQLENGNVYIAEMLALESYNSHPYCTESEMALRAVYDSINKVKDQYILVETIKYKETPQITGFHHKEHVFVVIHGKVADFYNSDNCQKIYSLDLSFEPEKARFSYNGTLLYFFSGNMLEIWDFVKKRKIFPASSTKDSLNILDVTDRFIIVQDNKSYDIKFLDIMGKSVIDSIPCNLQVDESAYNLQSSLLAISGISGIRLFNCSNGSLIYSEQSKRYVDKISFSPYGKYLYIVSSDSVCKYSIENVKDIHKYSFDNEERATLYSCSDTDDFFGFRDGDVICTHYGKKRMGFNAHRSNITDISLNQDRTMIITSSEDNTVKVWSSDFHQYDKSLGFCQTIGIDIDKSSNNHVLVHSSVGKHFVSVIEISTQKTKSFRTNINSYNHPKFVNDGKNVIYEKGGVFYMWNYNINLVTDSLRPIQNYYSDNWNVSPKGDIIAISTNDTMFVYKLNEKKLLKSIIAEGEIIELRFSTDGNFICVLTDKNLSIYNMYDLNLSENYILEDYVHNPYFSYFSTENFVMTEEDIYLLCNKKLIRVDRKSKKLLSQIICEGKELDYEEKSKKLVLHDDHKMFVFDKTLKFCQVIDVDKVNVNNVKFINENSLLSASDKIRWWSLYSFPVVNQKYAFSYTKDHDMLFQTEEKKISWELHYPHYIWCSDINDSRDKVVVTSSKGIHIIDCERGKNAICEFENDSIQSAVFFNNEKVYYRKTNDIKLYEWDYKLGTHKPFATLPNIITSLSLSRKKNILAAGTANGIYMIDFSGKIINRFSTSSDVMSVAFSDNDEYIVVALYEGIVKVIDLNNGHVLAIFMGKKDYTKTAVFVNNRQIASAIDEGIWAVYDIYTKKGVAKYTIEYDKYDKLYCQYDANYGLFRLNNSILRYPTIEVICKALKACKRGRTFTEEEIRKFGIKKHKKIKNFYF